jgi:hypothetical protein
MNSGSSDGNDGDEETAARTWPGISDVPGAASTSIKPEPAFASSGIGSSDGNDGVEETAADTWPGISEAPGSVSALKSLSLTQLRKRARETPGISEKKKVEGKWIPKDTDDFIADF